MTVKKISAIFLLTFCCQNLDVYGCKDCCDKCCEDCCKNCCVEELFWDKDLAQEEIGSLVSENWYNYQKDTKPVLKIFIKVENKTNAEGAILK